MSYVIFDRDIAKICELNYTIIDKQFSKGISAETLVSIFSNDDELFKLQFSCIKIGYATNQFVRLPLATQEIETIYKSVYSDALVDGEFLHQQLPDTSYFYYLVPSAIKQFFESRFETIQWYCGEHGLLNYQNSKRSFKQSLIAHIYGTDLSICLQQNGIPYFNKFYIEDKQDFLYYIKLCYEQLGLDANQFPTYVYGFIEEKSPLYTNAYGFIRNFEIDRTLKHDFGYQFTFDDNSQHYFINLLSLGQ